MREITLLLSAKDIFLIENNLPDMVPCNPHQTCSILVNNFIYLVLVNTPTTTL